MDSTLAFQMASAGFYWCGSESQPDLVRCFVCLKEFEDWEPDDIPRYETYFWVKVLQVSIPSFL